MLFLADVIDFSVFKPSFGLLFWTVVIFVLFWIIIGRAAFKPIVNALKKREGDIQGAMDEAKKAREEVAAMKASNEQILGEAREERAKILREAKEAKETIVKQAKEEAKAEAQKIIVAAKSEIENMKASAMTDLKNQVGTFAVDIAEQVLKSNLKGDAAQTDLVNKLVDDIKMN